MFTELMFFFVLSFNSNHIVAATAATVIDPEKNNNNKKKSRNRVTQDRFVQSPTPNRCRTVRPKKLHVVATK
jgi:hypothetical protein